jgi:hypothetical protein
MASPQVADGGTASKYEGYLRIYRISSRGQPTRGGPPAWELDEVLTTHRKNVCYETLKRPRTWNDPSVRPNLPMRSWQNTIKMDLHEVGCGSMDWMGLSQDRDRWRVFVNVVMNLLVTCHV